MRFESVSEANEYNIGWAGILCSHNYPMGTGFENIAGSFKIISSRIRYDIIARSKNWSPLFLFRNSWPILRRFNVTSIGAVMSLSTCPSIDIMSRFAAGMIIKITYGHTVTSIDDRYVQLAETAASGTLELGSAGAMIVDFIPFCTLHLSPSHG